MHLEIETNNFQLTDGVTGNSLLILNYDSSNS